MSTVTRAKNHRGNTSLMPHVPDFCPVCDATDHPFTPVKRKLEQEFRGETFEVEGSAFHCKHCEFAIAAPGALEALRVATLDAYRQRHGLLTSAEIVARRNAMGMSQRTFAAHLDIGVASLQRWEKGLMVQDRANDFVLRSRTDHTLYFPSFGQSSARTKRAHVTSTNVTVRFIQPACWAKRPRNEKRSSSKSTFDHLDSKHAICTPA